MNLPDYQKPLLKIQDPPMEGWCTLEKSVVLFELIETWKPKTIVEIGVFAGRSVIAMALACKHLNHGFVIGIDPWRVDACLEGSHPEEHQEWWAKIDFDYIASHYREKVKEFGVNKYVSHIQQHDRDVSHLFAPRSIDMIHFDSNHSPEESFLCVERWFPKLTNGAIIVMDDVDWKGQQPAIDALIYHGVLELDVFDKYAVYRKP